MLKSYTYSLLALMLVVSILAPSIELLCKSTTESVLVMDLSEEENNQKEIENKFDKKELFFSPDTENSKISFSKEITKSQLALLSYSGFKAEVIPPPPKLS